MLPRLQSRGPIGSVFAAQPHPTHTPQPLPTSSAALLALFQSWGTSSFLPKLVPMVEDSIKKKKNTPQVTRPSHASHPQTHQTSQSPTNCYSSPNMVAPPNQLTSHRPPPQPSPETLAPFQHTPGRLRWPCHHSPATSFPNTGNPFVASFRPPGPKPPNSTHPTNYTFSCSTHRNPLGPVCPSMPPALPPPFHFPSAPLPSFAPVTLPAQPPLTPPAPSRRPTRS